MINIQPTGGACGALVQGLNLSEDLTDDIMSDLTKALYNHRCLIIKTQNMKQKRIRGANIPYDYQFFPEIYFRIYFQEYIS